MAPMAVEIDSLTAINPGSGAQVKLEPQTVTAPLAVRENPKHEEYQYIDLIREILDDGEHRPDRTGTGTYSVFAPRAMRFSLSRPGPNGQAELVLPLLTTKRVFLRAVVAELLWFVSGNTSSKPLSDAGIHIWDGNGSREFLDNNGLSHRAEGDLGPVYGFQWRHFGAQYVNAETDYTGQGVDQLAEVIHKLRYSPWDRRIILSAWNPAAMKEMALPPCHMFAQFYVSFPSRRRCKDTTFTNRRRDNSVNAIEKDDHDAAEEPERGVLHTHLYQRSCDMGLGIPFNIASYAVLTHMLAHVCDLVPGTLTHAMGDAHVYLDHVEALEEQIARVPRDFPTLELQPQGETKAKGVCNVQGMEGWGVEDFVVKGYKPHGRIAMKMSV